MAQNSNQRQNVTLERGQMLQSCRNFREAIEILENIALNLSYFSVIIDFTMYSQSIDVSRLQYKIQ